jgi:hypothetical protein
VPNPLLVEIHRGEADLALVMTDVLGLTKINFNACVFADGLPVTLKFADAVGDILTAAPVGDLPPSHSDTTSKNCTSGNLRGRRPRSPGKMND